MQTRIINFVLPIFQQAAGSIKPSSPEKESALKSILNNPNIISNILGSLAERLQEKKILSFVQDLVKGTLVDGQDISKNEIFDLVFCGEMNLLFKIIKFIVEANYGDFFGENGILSKVISKAQIPTTGY